MQLLDNIKSKVFEEKKFFMLQNQRTPRYIILDRESYSLLKESMGIPGYEDIADYEGMMIHIIPKGQNYVDFL